MKDSLRPDRIAAVAARAAELPWETQAAGYNEEVLDVRAQAASRTGRRSHPHDQHGHGL